MYINFPTTTENYRLDVLVIGEADNLKTRKMTRESLQDERISFELSPCGALGTLSRRPVLMKH